MIIVSIIFALVFFFYCSLYFTPFCPNFRRKKTTDKIITLTFDDGPNPPFTDQIIAILDRYQIKATFFMIGHKIKANPDTVKSVLTSGHQIGNHSFSHSKLIFKTASSIKREIKKTDDSLRKAGVHGDIFFRTPHGMQFFAVCKYLKSTNRKNILFDVLVWDWMLKNPKLIVYFARLQIRPGSIITLHDGGGIRTATVQALPIIITNLLKSGYRFVGLDELLSSE